MGTAQFLPGINAAREALNQKTIRIKEVLIKEGKRGPRAEEIITKARERGINVRIKKGRDLDNLLPGTAHQGVIVLVEEFKYAPFEELVETALKAPSYALLLAADHITDEGNLGSLVRTGAFLGIQGLVLPRDRSAKMTETVMKRSAGACFFLPVARVVNLGRALDELDKKGFWIVGASAERSMTIYDFDWNRDVVLILGNEAKGLSPSIEKRCHELVTIPGSGRISSLNVSVAGGIIASEIMRQRNVTPSQKGRFQA